MNKEYLRLHKLWQEDKLTKAEFKLLSSKIATNTWLDIVLMWIFSPFSKLSSKNDLILGSVLILLSSSIAYFGGFHFPSISGWQEIIDPAKRIGFLRILIEHFIQWFILSITLYLITKISRAKNVLLLDFFAFVAMAVLARVVFGVEIWLVKLISSDFFSNSADTKYLILHYLRIFVGLWIVTQWLMYIWLYRLYFVAFELASGLSKVRLWVTFIAGIIIANTICYNIHLKWF